MTPLSRVVTVVELGERLKELEELRLTLVWRDRAFHIGIYDERREKLVEGAHPTDIEEAIGIALKLARFRRGK